MNARARETGADAPTDGLPVVDIAPMRGDDPGARADSGRAVAEACATAGFLYVVGHGVPRAEMDGILDQARRLFGPDRDRLPGVSIERSPHWRGWLPARARGRDAALKGNNQEAFQIQREEPGGEDVDAMRAALHGPNLWPEDMPDFRAAMTGWWARMEALSRDLLRAFAIGLGLPEDAFLRHYDHPLAQLRLLHYPPQSEPEDSGILGIRPHTDTGAFTILLQDSVGGLQVESLDGEWLDVEPIADAFVINIGDMMRIWTNGRFRSTRHRVINRSGAERYSVPFFVNPDFDAVAEPEPALLAADEAPAFEPLPVGPFIYERFSNVWPRAEPGTAATPSGD
ncbi:MAG: 2OG-Fe(II) oxygenase family protein [Azospirillaceae bacterium]